MVVLALNMYDPHSHNEGFRGIVKFVLRGPLYKPIIT
jgi:hypothetical protein